eukprot:COSAG01_NODE_17007_length_1185_cov_1.609576_2_plen_74_part_00
MHPAGEKSAESLIQLHVQIMLRNILAAGSKIHSGFEEIELLIDRSEDFLNSACRGGLQQPNALALIHLYALWL